MQKIHTKLTQKYSAYHNWHQTKHHNKIHWGALVVFTLLVFGTISRWTPISLAADTVPPTIPTNLTASAISSSQINFSWTASTDDVEVTGYKIYRCAGSACAPTVLISTSATNSYSDTGLTASTAYTYAVSAYDAAGNNSAQSTSASATTQAQTGVNITGVSGTLTNGSMITVTGSGFGIKSPAKPLIWANFESGSINPTNLGVMTTWTGIQDFSLTTSNQSVNSTYAVFGEYNWGLGKKGPAFRSDYNYFQKIYVSLKRYRDYAYYSTINQKFFRIWPDLGGSINDFLGEYLGNTNPNNVGRAYTENTNETYNGPGNSYQGSIFTPNKWETEEFQWSQNSALDVADGTWRFWRNGGILQTRTNLIGRSTAQSGNITRLYIDNFSGGGVSNMPPDGSRVYVDDIYIDNTWARVIIGNQSTFDISSHREIQIPSAWANNSITVTLNQGEFTNGQTAYLYIVDENGNVNANGYPITIGLTLDTEPPTTPANLTATPISSSQINLYWTASNDNTAVTGYKIYRCAGSACAPTTQIATSATNSYSDTGLTTFTTYTYAVSAYDGAGNESGKFSSLATTLTQTTPAINSVSGNFVNGSSVMINGVNFDSKTRPQPVLWDNFETGIPNSVLDMTPQIGTWLKDSRPPAIYSTSQAHSGNKSSYSAYDGTHQWSQFVVNPLPIAEKFYQSFWFLYNTTGTNGQLKLMQVHGDSGLGDFAPGIMTGSSGIDWWFGYISTESGANNLNTRANYPATPSPNAWHHFEMILKRSSAGNVPDGNVIIKVDNVVVYNKTNVVTRENSAYNWNEISFFHGVTNMGGNTNVFVDDAYLNDAWSRVTIADNPIYANISHGEIQIPTTWSDNSITFTANQGTFQNGQTAYLYVIDENGNVNENGYPVAVGGIQVDAQAPTTPTNLSATVISSSQINLSWTASTDNVGVTGYKIYRCAGSACAPTVQIATSAVNSYPNTGLTASTAYTYAVSAYDAAGNESGKSSFVSATTLSQFKPSDLNQDQKVDQQDFDILKQDWNRTDKPKSDLNQDGIVDSRDLGIMMSEWTR